MNKRLRNAIKKAENKQNEADLALQSIWKHLAFSGFRDIEPNLSMTPGNEIMLEWNCSEMNANEIIDCMESAGYITPDDFIGSVRLKYKIIKREDIGKAAKIYQEKDMISGQVKA